MMEATARSALAQLQDDLLAAWAHGQWQRLSLMLTDDALLTSNQHGIGTGSAEWQGLLGTDSPNLAWMRTSNLAFLTENDQNAASSAYVIGLFESGLKQLLFGASVVLEYKFQAAKGRWMVIGARVNINWCRGDLTLVTHWRMPPTDTGWQLGDPPPVIVSELDSPWAKIRAASPFPAKEEAVIELYSKYSWAIDQGDITLLNDCYTEDAAGGFAPIGPLQGRRAIVGQLKSFRRLWPWMQHFADVVRLEFEEDGAHARMIVARIIPEYPVDASGRAVYGAHYQIRVRREDDDQWRICWSDYRPGWFSSADVPAFEIEVTHAKPHQGKPT